MASPAQVLDGVALIKPPLLTCRAMEIACSWVNPTRGDGLATCEGFGAAQADVMRMTASPAAAIAPASVNQ